MPLQHSPPSAPLRLLPDARTVLIVDPHAVTREGLKAVINMSQGVRVVGEAGDGPTALAQAKELNPDLVVMEAVLPGLGGAYVAARLRAVKDQSVLVLTASEHAGMARLFLGMGVRGYVLKSSSTENVEEAVRTIAAGGRYFSPGIIGHSSGEGPRGPSGMALVEREVTVLVLVARGYSNKEISVKLMCSVKSVEIHKRRAMRRLELRSRVDLVHMAAAHGWLADRGSHAAPGTLPT